MLAISVREALRDAVSAFGEAVDGSRAVPLGCPATHEAIFAAIQSRIGRAEAAE
jgi:xanthine dehydrogenase molybdopterin-binding subunit B